MKRAAAAPPTKAKKPKMNKKPPKPQQAKDTNNCTDSDSTAVYKSMFEALKKQVDQQQHLIDELTTRMSFVVSWLENSVTPEQCTSAFQDFAAAVKRPSTSVVADRATRESIVAAVYVDKQRRSNRATNFVVSGLPQSDDKTDHEAVIELCCREYNEVPDVVHTTRIGKIVNGRIQPLLVILKTAAQAVRFIAAAKKLRQSADQYTQQNIFISANLTKAEARAAYEIRCQRRQAASRKQKQEQQQRQQQQSQQLQQLQPTSVSSSVPHQLVAVRATAPWSSQQQQPHHQQRQQQQQPGQMSVVAEVHYPPLNRQLSQQQTVVADVHHPRPQRQPPLQLSHQRPTVSQQYWQQQQQLPTMLPRDCVVGAGPISPQQSFYQSAVPYPAAPAYSSLQLPVPPVAWSVSSSSNGQH